jgi:Transposase IS116/IS110/IS902 family
VKLESVVTDVSGKASRSMVEALIAGERDPVVLAEMALTRIRPKIPELRKALVGRFEDHHALLARMHLDHIDELTAMVACLDEEVDRLMAPFAEPAHRLTSVPGVGKRTAEVVVAEIGVDMSRFPSAAHLASWAGLCPGNDEPAGKRRSGRARKGDEALRTALCEAAWGGFARQEHLRVGPVPPLHAPLWHQGRGQGHFRRRPHARRHYLARPQRSLYLRRTWRRLVRPPHRCRSPQALPRPPVGSPRPQRHHHARGLTQGTLPIAKVGAYGPKRGSAPHPVLARRHASVTREVSCERVSELPVDDSRWGVVATTCPKRAQGPSRAEWMNY